MSDEKRREWWIGLYNGELAHVSTQPIPDCGGSDPLEVIHVIPSEDARVTARTLAAEVERLKACLKDIGDAKEAGPCEMYDKEDLEQACAIASLAAIGVGSVKGLAITLKATRINEADRLGKIDLFEVTEQRDQQQAELARLRERVRELEGCLQEFVNASSPVTTSGVIQHGYVTDKARELLKEGA